MNLTSKRVLQFMTVCAGACALSASAATTWLADSYEELDGGATNKLIASYKGLEGSGGSIPAYTVVAGDASKIVGRVGTYSGTRPMSSVLTDLVLNLETEGQTLSRGLDSAKNFTLGPVYVDTLIKFTPSEDAPVISDAAVKAAVFVNVISNLVIYHNNLDIAAKVSTETSVHINPDQWYRLTILLSAPSGQKAFKVYVDGTAITSALAYDDAGNHPGEWFASASTGEDISAIAFQGTGMVDELVVTDTTPAGIGSLSVYEQWLVTEGITQEDMDNNPAWMNDYLLNVAHNSGSGIVIDSIEMAGNVATIVVTASTVPVDFNDLNGVLVVKTSDLLSTLDAATPASYPISFPNLPDTSSATVTVTLPPTHTFIKAVVQ